MVITNKINFNWGAFNCRLKLESIAIDGGKWNRIMRKHGKKLKWYKELPTGWDYVDLYYNRSNIAIINEQKQ